MTALTRRKLTAVAAIIMVILAGSYLLGDRDKSTNQPGPEIAFTAPNQSASTTATASPPANTLPKAAVDWDEEQFDTPRTPLPAEPDGPFGSRQTTGSRQVALTFDDGPDPRYTPQALSLLRRHRVTATFCLVGQNAQAYPQLVRAIVADGHTLCNHSWNHDFKLGSRSPATIRADLVRTNKAIRAAVPNAQISYYRQPGGKWTARVVAVARDLGMTSLHWAVDPQDWRRPGATKISANVTANTTAGAIVLLHDAGGDRRGTISALRSILPNLTRRFELAALPPGDAHNAPRSAG
ncbi:MAG TPA: polysaccharide deacetylase family protein [Micromonosporaceae bacterium]|nr:polysaccharide deacetylase family protein [Micromonosporaceae bacterium]